MTLSRDSVLALQRHFLGALTLPARTWLEPLPSQSLAFAADTLRRSGEECVLDFGTVETPGEERHTVRVFRPAGDGARVQLADSPPWLEARWTNHDTLELLARHDGEAVLRGSLLFRVNDARDEFLLVRMATRRSHPAARFDFNGSPVPQPFDFGAGDHPYQLSVANDASVPLVVSFADLPAWLTFEVNGQHRSGPLPGRFFARKAPFCVRIRPHVLGRHEGAIRIYTNDPRPELQTFDLDFTACMAPARPFVRVRPPSGRRLRMDQTFTLEAQIENWGRTPARTTKKAASPGLNVSKLPVIPAAHDGVPGTASLPIRIIPGQLAPGTHELSLVLSIEAGEPPEVNVPVHVEVIPAQRSARPWRAALLALLLLTLALYVVGGLP